MTRSAESWILVVDDDRDICLNLTDILTDLGYRADYALDGPSALELVRQRPYDVALLDLKMPGMDGLTLFREIKNQRAGIVSLLVTAYAGPAITEEGFPPGHGRSLPSLSTLPSSCCWSMRRSTSRWSWWSMTIVTFAPVSGTSSASTASELALRTTTSRRPNSSKSRRSRSS